MRQTLFIFYMKQQRKMYLFILSKCHIPLFPFGSFFRKSGFFALDFFVAISVTVKVFDTYWGLSTSTRFEDQKL